jgi:hypothetical protein
VNALTEAIEKFEAALVADKNEFKPGSALALRCHDRRRQAEAALMEALGRAVGCDAHAAVCELSVAGCTEGIEHDGTVYAVGFGPDGEPGLILMRRITPAARAGDPRRAAG